MQIKLSNQIAIRNKQEKMLCMQSLSEKLKRWLALRIFLCFSRHLAKYAAIQ